jgi:acyl carrier protein
VIANNSADSLDVVTLVAEVEKRYPRANLFDKAAENVKTLRHLAAYVDGETNPFQVLHLYHTVQTL